MKLYRGSVGVWLLAVLAATLTACGNGDNNNGAPSTPTARPSATNTAPVTPTAQPTATLQPTATPQPTPTSTGAGVTGLVVLNRNVSANVADALGAPPQPWTGSADGGSFDRALAAANWSLDGSRQGVTGPDGRFVIGTLPPGTHTLQVTKTLDGNLATASVPFTVGEDGSANLVIEVAWGQVKSSATYTAGDVQVRDVHAPNGSWLKLHDGRIAAFGNWVQTFEDDNGDGEFDVTPCSAQAPATSYPCSSDATCSQPGDRCVCIPSCPACDDCPKTECVPECTPVDITGISVSGPSQLIVGQQGSMSAFAQLSDGSTFDLTGLADWTSSDPTVATIDSWGTVNALQPGSTSLTATFGTFTSAPWPLQVSTRPPLQHITVQNVSCYFPMGGPTAGSALPPDASPGQRSDILPVPNCTQVVEIGATIQFRAIGQFADNYYEDITDQVQWQVNPAEVGSIAAGLFTAAQAGSAAITASLDSVTSDPTDVKVVTQPTVVGLTIYADNGGFPVVTNSDATGGTAPPAVGSGMPCILVGPMSAQTATPCCCPGPLADGEAGPCRCSYSITVLRGDTLQFHATAQYDTGAWKDVTNEVTWVSSDPTVASIDATGAMSALQAGDTNITATLESVTSDPAAVHVVDHATLQSIWIYQEGQDRVVAKGDQRFFHAVGNYDVGISREITIEATWRSSDEAVGGFDTPGVFTARAAGDVQVWAELETVQSNQLPLEVYETSDITYCDPNNINRSVWSDDFNRVTLESDCAWYTQPAVVTLRYSVTEIQPHGGIFNPCLDLYVYAADNTKIRTIREEGCGDPFLAANAPGRDQEVLKYQLRAFWDLKDDSGNAVPPGTYTIYGRFYLYYDPVVSLDVAVLAPGQDTPTPRPTNAVTPTATPVSVTGACDVCDGRRCVLSTGMAGTCLPQADGCACVAAVTPQPVCTPPACTAVACTQDGAVNGDGGDACCPSGWYMYPCTFAEGATGLACHNPLLGCPSSDVCGEGCDPVVTGRCQGCVDGCGLTCASGVLPPTPTPAEPQQGNCFIGQLNCSGSSFPSAMEDCCAKAAAEQVQAVSWCPDQPDTATGACGPCVSPVCGPPPGTTPTPVVNPYGCGDVCDGRPCGGGFCVVDSPNGCACEGPTPTTTPMM